MRRNRNATFIATPGPANAEPATIRALFEARADVFCSHSSQDELASRIRSIRDLENTSGRPVAIMLDREGAKLRSARGEPPAAEGD